MELMVVAVGIAFFVCQIGCGNVEEEIKLGLFVPPALLHTRIYIDTRIG